MSDRPYYIESTNLTTAWISLLEKLIQQGVKSVAPSVVTVDLVENSTLQENNRVRNLIDAELKKIGESSIETVANTIFPNSLWNRSLDRTELYERYKKILPKLKRYKQNNLGHYFNRMISHPDKINQLEHVITTWQKGNHRHSALQVAIFDPSKDHVHSPRRGFPCLHQIAVTPLANSRLAIQAFYATQHLLTKTYGNILGLFRLGQFMAHEMELELDRITCIAGRQELGASKRDCRKLLEKSLGHLTQ